MEWTVEESELHSRDGRGIFLFPPASTQPPMEWTTGVLARGKATGA
jgi:hypothetical protein